MERRDNYAIAAARARQLFVNYDHEALARKLRTQLDETYLYTKLLGEPYRIHRTTGDISRFSNGEWVSANSFNESLTLLDLVCDSRDDRFPSGRWKNMSDFGPQFLHIIAVSLLAEAPEVVQVLADLGSGVPDEFAEIL